MLLNLQEEFKELHEDDQKSLNEANNNVELSKKIVPALRKIRSTFEAANCWIDFELSRDNLMVRYRLFDPEDNHLNRNNLYSYFSLAMREEFEDPNMLYEKLSDILKKDIQRELNDMITAFTNVSNEIISEL